MGLQGQKIEATSFNIIKDASILVYGTGSGQLGYGQPVTNPVSVGDLISASTWNTLRSELVKARQHQTGILVGNSLVNDGNNLVEIDSSMVITDAIRQQYADFSNVIQLYSQNVAATELVSTVVINSVRNLSWNGTVVHAITIQGSPLGDGPENNLRYFFNAGGKIGLSPSITGGIPTAKLTFWRDIFLPQVGEVQLTATETTNTGNSGISTNLGFYDLTSIDQVLYTLNGTGVYSLNYYKVTGSISSDKTTIDIKVVYADNSNDGTAIDQNVTGALSSIVTTYSPVSTNVEVLPLVVTDTGINNGVPPLSFVVIPRKTSINETTNREVILDVITSDIGTASTMYWSTSGSVNALDFSDNVLTGSVFINTNGIGTITRTLATDKMYDGVESFQIVLHSNSPTGLEACRSSVIIISDTSNYEFNSNLTVDEGSNFTFTINSTPSVNTRLYVTLSGTASSSIGVNQGYIDLVNGFATKSFLIPTDTVTDPGQQFSVVLRSSAATGPVVLTSPSITVIDKTPTYTVTYSATDWILSEGENLSYTVRTTNVPDGTYLYVSIVNHSTTKLLSSDVVNGLGNRLVLINNNVGIGYITMAVNGGTEPERKFYLNFTTVTGTLVHSSSWVNPLTWFILRAHGIELYYSSGGTYTFSVPRGVTELLITGVGPGGGSVGWHDAGYSKYVRPGGPGGGVQFRLSVTFNEVITVNMGIAGGGGKYGGSDYALGYGSAATNTVISDSSGVAARIYCGGNYNKTPGQGYLRSGLNGSTSSGQPSVEIGGTEVGYSIWNFISQDLIGINGAGTPPGYKLPSGVNTQAGRAERPGWVTIQY